MCIFHKNAQVVSVSFHKGHCHPVISFVDYIHIIDYSIKLFVIDYIH